jgi:hypothetical protein
LLLGRGVCGRQGEGKGWDVCECVHVKGMPGWDSSAAFCRSTWRSKGEGMAVAPRGGAAVPGGKWTCGQAGQAATGCGPPPPFCSLTCTGTATSPANTCRRGSTAGTGAGGAAGMVGCSPGRSGRRRRRCSEEVAQAAVAASSSAKALERATRNTRAIVEAHKECSSSMALQRKGSNEELQREEGWARKRAGPPTPASPALALRQAQLRHCNAATCMQTRSNVTAEQASQLPALATPTCVFECKPEITVPSFRFTSC